MTSSMRLTGGIIVLGALVVAGSACSRSAHTPPAGSGQAQSGAPSASPVVARVADRAFTLDEIDQHALSVDAGAFQGLQLRQALYEARRRAVDEAVAQELFAREAKARGISPDALVQQEVMSQIAPVPDSAVAAWYEANKNRAGGASLDQVRDQIRQYLEQQRLNQASALFISRLKAKTKVEVTLEPPRVPVSIPADAPALGPATARVQVVEFADFQCPYCGQAAPLLKRMTDHYGDKIRIVFRNFPLPIHPQAPEAAVAARCAQAQGKFWQYHDRLFANQKALASTDLKRYAAELGLNAAGFDACLKDGAVTKAVQADFADGQGYGVNATPTFFINGRLLSGAQPFESFQQVIDEELARAR